MKAINETGKMTLKFRAEETDKVCKGCWGENPATYKCFLLIDSFGPCLYCFRPDKKNIVYKLIKR